MRFALAAVVFLLLFVPHGSADTVSSPEYVNFLLDHFQTPDLAPGESGPFTFVFNNTYDWQMSNISLRLEMYRYREIDVDLAVDASWSGPDFFEGTNNYHRGVDPRVPRSLSAHGPGVIVPLTVVTYPETRHGSLTSQGSYFVRTRLTFDYVENRTAYHAVLMSKGWFTDAQFETARCPTPVNQTCPSPPIRTSGLLNLTYLGSLYGLDHLDGLLPDTAFSVQDHMPLWPFYAVGGVMAASLVFAVLFYAEENPGKLPRLAQWWLGMKGKARQARPPKAR